MLPAAALHSIAARAAPASARPRGIALPEWTNTLTRVSTAARTLAASPLPPDDGYQPFAQPWLAVAREQLSLHQPGFIARMSEAARTASEAALGELLLRLARDALEVEHTVQRAQTQATRPPGETSTATRSAEPGESSPTGFIRQLFADGFGNFYATYPVLARQLARAVERWHDALVAFQHDWLADERTLSRVFHGGQPLGDLTALSTSLGDLHCGGRSVMALTFTSGVRLVYKPRSCRLEQAWFALQAWCAQRDPALEFKPVTVLDCGTHGWMEFVAPRDCVDEAEVHRYFRSCGRLLGLAHALAAGDFHHENIVAQGPNAVVVDAELLVTPLAVDSAGATSDGATTLAGNLWGNSVMATSLLPQWSPLRPGVSLNLAGIGADVSAHPDAGHRPHNLPRLNGRPVTCSDYVDDIVAGFSQLYDFLLAHRTAFLATDGALAGWAEHPVRFVNRSTGVYARLQHRATHASLLVDPTLRTREFERLHRALDATPTTRQPMERRVIAAEIAALEEGDVPYFQTLAGSRDLPLPDGSVLRGFFCRSGLERARERIRRLSAAGRAQQISIIRSSFHLAQAIDASHRPHCAAVPPARVENTAPADDALLRSAALALVRTLASTAVRTNGSATWIGAQLVPETERYHMRPLGVGLYDGLTGVALFLAAATRVTGDATARTLSDQINASLRDSLWQQRTARDLVHTGLGLAGGVGGVLYGLTQIAALLGQSEIADLAARIAVSVTPDALARDTRLDLAGGSAGAILALLAYHAETDDPRALATAVCAGEQLLRRREPGVGGHRTWRVDGVHLTGFSHGAAGFACALLRLHAATGEADFKTAAEEAIAHENALFDTGRRNWPDLRTHVRRPDGPVFMNAWCHGAPGIALGRLATLDVLDTPALRADIAAGLAQTVSHPAADLDHCCCGNTGRIEILHVAAQRLNDAALQRRARELAGTVITRARAHGGYSCFRGLPRDVQNPGFFQGHSGIGYTFLRLLSPASVPSALQFEALASRVAPAVSE